MGMHPFIGPLHSAPLSNHNHSFTTSVIVGCPVGTVVGNLLVVLLADVNAAGTFGYPAGWVEATSVLQTTAGCYAVASKVAVSADIGANFTFTGVQEPTAILLSSSFSSIDAAAYLETTGSNTISAPSVTASTNADYWITAFADNGNSGQTAPPTGFTLLIKDEGGGVYYYVYTKQLTTSGATGAATTTENGGSTLNAMGLSVLLK